MSPAKEVPDSSTRYVTVAHNGIIIYHSRLLLRNGRTNVGTLVVLTQGGTTWQTQVC
jgi:hypothetical protein